MKSITIRIDDPLFDWLNEQARLNHRSKNRQIEHLLEQARRMPVNNKADRSRYQLGINRLCANGTHLFSSSNPATSEFCNCGVFVFGEVMG